MIGNENESAEVLAVVDEHSPERVVREAKRLADTLGKSSWTALHVETAAAPASTEAVHEALTLASRLGATVASIPGENQADAITGFAAESAVSHIVIGVAPEARRWPAWRRSTARHLVDRGFDGILVIVPPGGPSPLERAARARPSAPASATDYAVSALAVLATIPVLLLLRSLIGGQALILIFLFPVLAVAARSGFAPAVLAALLSTLAYNFFILRPIYSLSLTAPQNLLMLGVLLPLAGYASFLTARLRERAALSDRSAQENASLAAFGANLAKVSNWESTADIVCREMSSMLHVESALLREVEGRLVVAGALPAEPSLGPVDQTALDWAWSHGDAAGAGTEVLSTANWQFQPLKTSLGMLAVLGLAREDGRNPVRTDRKVLLATLLSQASLALERLRLEDEMRATSKPGGT